MVADCCSDGCCFSDGAGVEHPGRGGRRAVGAALVLQGSPTARHRPAQLRHRLPLRGAALPLHAVR